MIKNFDKVISSYYKYLFLISVFISALAFSGFQSKTTTYTEQCDSIEIEKDEAKQDLRSIKYSQGKRAYYLLGLRLTPSQEYSIYQKSEYLLYQSTLRFHKVHLCTIDKKSLIQPKIPFSENEDYLILS